MVNKLPKLCEEKKRFYYQNIKNFWLFGQKYKKIIVMFFHGAFIWNHPIVNRPGVAGAVLQRGLSLFN